MQKLRPDMNIGQNIQKIRYGLKMTQEQVVAQMQLYDCKLSRVTYAKMEGNHYNICISELLALKAIFKVNLDDFFEGLEVQRIDLP